MKLDTQLGLVVSSAWADSTLRTRNSQWSKFIDFCHLNGLIPVPTDSLTVARFLVDLGKDHAFSTCNNYFSAIVCLQKFFGYDLQLRQSFVLQLVMKGLGRTLGKNVNQKVGLSPSELLRIYSMLQLSDVNVISKWSALILAFRSLLRKSNIVQTTYKDTGMIIMRSDVEFTLHGIVLNVRKTKTIQANEYVLKIPINYIRNPGLCAASMLCSHFARTRHISEGPLFYLLNKKGEWKPLLYRELLDFLKDIVKLIGLPPNEVGLHSMRRAGAAYLHSVGVSLIDIMSAGDWKSLAALAYLITPLSRKLEIEDMVSNALQDVVSI